MDQPLLFRSDGLKEAWAATPEAKMQHLIYIPSLGRAKTAMTANFLRNFQFVVEKAEYRAYADRFGAERVLSLPGDDYGGPEFVRNWIKAYSRGQGHAWHWQLDDNISKIQRHEKRQGKSVYTDIDAEVALGRIERFVDYYTNIGIAGLSHIAFAWTRSSSFTVNQGIYSCVLVAENDLQWRHGVIEDTDYSLQILSAGMCTILFSEYVIYKAKTQSMAGGNTGNIYKGDGRLRNIEGLQRAWPYLGIGKMERFGKPVAKTSHVWRKFPQQPIEKE